MATIAELLEAANRKVQRGEETKALLKTRLTEKGLDVASENNFYNLADKVGEIETVGGTVSVLLSDLTGYGTNSVIFEFSQGGKLKNDSISPFEVKTVQVDINTILFYSGDFNSSPILSGYLSDVETGEGYGVVFVSGECQITW